MKTEPRLKPTGGTEPRLKPEDQMTDAKMLPEEKEFLNQLSRQVAFAGMKQVRRVVTTAYLRGKDTRAVNDASLSDLRKKVESFLCNIRDHDILSPDCGKGCIEEMAREASVVLSLLNSAPQSDVLGEVEREIEALEPALGEPTVLKEYILATIRAHRRKEESV